MAQEIRQRANDPDEVFAAEVLIGEVLTAEMDRGRIAIAVELEWSPSGPVVHLYDQGDPFGERAHRDELRRSLIESFGDYLDIATTGQGNHISFVVPVEVGRTVDAEPADHRLWRLATELVARRSRSIVEQIQQTTGQAFSSQATDEATS